MQKKYIVQLSEDERCQLREVIKQLKPTSLRCAWNRLANWSLRLLSRQVVELGIVDSVSAHCKQVILNCRK